MKKFLIILLCILILVITCICCVRGALIPDFKVTIGLPKNDSAIDFSKSKSLIAPEDIDTVIFAFMNATPSEDLQIKSTTADAVVMISGSKSEISYNYYLWLEDDRIIISSSSDHFRVIAGSAAETLRTIVNDQLANYK